MAEFLLTRPLRDVTGILLLSFQISSISTHTPLAGRDNISTCRNAQKNEFLLTRPLRDVTRSGDYDNAALEFLLTRPLRDVTSQSGIYHGCSKFLLTRPLRDVTRDISETYWG